MDTLFRNYKQYISPNVSMGNFLQYDICFPAYVFERDASNPLLKDLFVTWAGYYEKAHGHVLTTRILEDEYCMLYCIEGKGTFYSNGILFPIQAGDCFFLFKNVEHSYFADKETPWTKYWMGFSGELSSAYLRHLGVSPDNPVLHIGIDSSLVNLFFDTLDIFKTGFHSANMLHAATNLRCIFSRIIDLQFTKKLVVTGTITMNDIFEIMLSNLSRPLTLDELAEDTGMSKYSLIRKFREKTGYPPLEYFTRLKIQRACQLLKAENKKVKDVSEELGFSSPYYFSLVFKRYTNMSPTEFRHSKAFFEPEFPCFSKDK
ncbi:MAG: AraC family transcriptional regulator [Massiliimalia sp.]|jgi:AraC family transcriptional regulator of arabinose operon